MTSNLSSILGWNAWSTQLVRCAEYKENFALQLIKYFIGIGIKVFIKFSYFPSITCLKRSDGIWQVGGVEGDSTDNCRQLTLHEEDRDEEAESDVTDWEHGEKDVEEDPICEYRYLERNEVSRRFEWSWNWVKMKLTVNSSEDLMFSYRKPVYYCVLVWNEHSWEQGWNIRVE